MQTDNPLPLNPAIEVLEQWVDNPLNSNQGAQDIPLQVLQYWDNPNPPDEIQALIDHSRSLCEKQGVGFVLFNQQQATEYLSSHFSNSYLQTWQRLPHPAMQSDLFRLCYLYKEGGFYLDADMVLRKNFKKLFQLKNDYAVFKWDLPERRNICNWLIGARPTSPIAEYVMEVVWKITGEACKNNPDDALKRILGVSGPGIFTRAIATFLANWQAATKPAESAVVMESVQYAYKHVQNGPEFLKRKLEYKSTALHWQVAANEMDNN